MRCVAWYCACFLILFCLGSSPRSVSHSLSCSSSAASDSSQSLSGSGNVVSRSSSSSGGLLLFADAQILHDALSDVEREEARLQEEAAIAAGRGHRLGALYQQRRAQQRRRRQRARDGSRPLPRAPALVRIDPHSGAEEAFVAPAPAQRSIRIPKRRGIPGRGGGSGSGSSRSPSQQGRTKRLRATSISQAHEQQPQQQQTPAGPQTTEENQHQQITQGQDQLQQQQLQQSEQEQPTQQHQELSEQQQQQQQQQQPDDPPLDRDPRTANDTSASTDAAATSDFTDPSMGPEELARAGMFEPGLVGRLGAVRSESRHQVEQAYFGQSVVAKVLDDSSPLASPSRSSATAVALMVLVPLIGLAVFYAVYSVMEGRRVRHGSWDNDLAAQDSINSAAARGAAGASSVPFRGGSVAGAGGGAGHKPKSKGKESAATRARRALGELDADDDWEVPLCIDDVERGADDGL